MCTHTFLGRGMYIVLEDLLKLRGSLGNMEFEWHSSFSGNKV